MLYKIEKRAVPLTTRHDIALSPIPHIHPHLELIYMEEGSSIASVDNKEFLIEKGDLFLSFPNQIHHYHDKEPVQAFIFIFAPDLFKDLKEIFQNKIPASPIIKSAQLPGDVKSKLKKILKKNSSESIYDKASAKGYLLAFLGEILPLMSLVTNTADHDSIKNVLIYCTQHYTEPLSLDTISKELHLNKYYISHIFKERMNISFTDFVNSLRIEHACNLLEKDSSITDVAFSSGFSSIRTFNRVFADNMGMSPRDFIKQKELAQEEETGKKENMQKETALKEDAGKGIQKDAANVAREATGTGSKDIASWNSTQSGSASKSSVQKDLPPSPFIDCLC